MAPHVEGPVWVVRLQSLQRLQSSTLVFLKMASDVGGKLAVLGVLALAARALTTQAFAYMALASTLGWMLSVATDFGLQLHLAREVARAPDHAGRALWPLLRIRMRMLIVGVVIAVVASFVWLPAKSAAPFACVAVSYIINALVEFLNYAYRGLNRSDLESTLNFAQRLVTLALAWVLLSLWPSFPAAAVAVTLPPLLASIVSLLLLRRMAPAEAVTLAPIPTRALFREVAPIGAGIVFSALYFRIDVFLLQHWSGPESVAHYSAVFRLIDALRLFPAAFLAVVMPMMFRGRDAAFLWKMSIGLTVFGIVSSLLLYVAAPMVVPLAFGDSYAAATPLFSGSASERSDVRY